jgi:hypothetical protein
MRLVRSFPTRALSALGVALVLALSGLSGQAAAQTGLPTFQGSLLSSGLPATGTYDVRFSLFAAASGGTALQSGIVSDVAVNNGLFTATLPFDPNLYSASSVRWLAIDVRTAGTTTFTALSPRQALSPAPSALSMPGVNRQAGTTPDQNIAESATAPGSSLNLTRWQSFTCTGTGLLRSCTVEIGHTVNTTRTVTANLYAGEGTGGTPIATTTFVVPPNVPSVPLTAVFNAAPRVSPGDVLTLSLVTNSSAVSWGLSPTDVYAGGRSSVSATQDFNLKTFIEVDGATPSYSFVGKLSAPSAELGAYQGGTGTSAVDTYNKQLVLGGAFDTTFNAGSSVKLLIADYNNDAGADIYPIYAEDENNIVDFFLRKSGSLTPGPALAYFGGNVGIGVLAPINKLSVAGNADVTGNLGIGIVTASNRLSVSGNANVTGNLGIGTPTPALPLDVNGKIRVQGAIQNSATPVTTTDMGLFNSTSGASLRLVTNAAPIQFFTDYTDGAGTTSGSPTMTLSSAGNLGLGVPTPGAKLDISSPSVAVGAWQVLIRNDSTAFRGGIRLTNDGFLDVTNNAQNGSAAVSARLSGVGTWSSTSDARMKNDITTMPTGQLLDAALKLRPVTFYFNAEKLNGQLPAQPHLGLIAQEAQSVVPDLVSQGEGLFTLNYAGLSVVALGAIQEQQKLVTDLRGQVDSLRTEASALRADNDTLKQELREMRSRLDRIERVERLERGVRATP